MQSEDGRDEYVDRGAWRTPVTRPEVIDEIADGFERRTDAPGPRSTASVARTDAASRWPSRSRGWRSADLMHTHPAPHATT